MDDYSAYLNPAVKELLRKRGYFLVSLPEELTEDLQVNDKDLQHPRKALYHDKETLLMIEKLREHPDEIPSPNRDVIRLEI